MTPIADRYPVSPWPEIDGALDAAAGAFAELQKTPHDHLARFLQTYAGRIEKRRDELVAMAHAETGLAIEPRLRDVELPRTTDQLRQAAGCAKDRSWTLPTIDVARNIRSMHWPLGPVVVLGPNNFPFAYNAVSGGDFAAAIAVGCPVIAKGHPSHPGVTRLLAEEAFAAVKESGLPLATVQLLYHLGNNDGLKLVADHRVGATAFTGSRAGGLALKAAADEAGKPIYLEMGSINPVVILPGALRERRAKVLDDFVTSGLMGAGQFCTNPGLVILVESPESNAFITEVAERYKAAPIGTLLNFGVQKNLGESVAALRQSGAELLTGGEPGGGQGYCYRNTLMRVTGQQFLAKPDALQREAFGNASLMVVCKDLGEVEQVVARLHGSLTSGIYTHTAGEDDAAYATIEPVLRLRSGRLLNDKMPTGVAVSPAMNHGGPFPATGHPGFTSVGFPASLRRFTMLACYDNVRLERLPPELRMAGEKAG
jgi:NADP-dependent aldehyde dehydrogenase